MGTVGGSSFRTEDVDEAREELDARYYANRMDVVDRQRPFAARFETGGLGARVVGDLELRDSTCGSSFGERGA
ncbi:hypothetical protein [Streptomyces narbonensis]